MNEGDASAKGIISLAEARGVRVRQHCTVEWHKDAKSGLSFGLSTEGRTYYLYGTDREEIRWGVLDIE